MRRVLWARQWPLTLLLVAVLGLTSWGTRALEVRVPFVDVPLPAREFVPPALVAALLVPLYTRFPELAPSLLREAQVRVAATCGALVIGSGALAPTWLHVRGVGQNWTAEAAMFALLWSVSLLALTVVGELAWVVPLGLGVMMLLAEGTPGRPVSRAVSTMPLWAWAAVTLLTSGWFMYLGPRRTQN